jgi:outer membrane protein assembly factor BamB
MRLLGLSVTLFAAVAVWAGDWPQYLGPTRDGHTTADLRRTWPAAGPPIVWHQAVGAGFSGPIVVGQRVLLYHRQARNEVLTCWDARTGNRHWEANSATDYVDDFGFDDGPRATPVVVDNTVITLGAGGQLSSWNLADGARRWQRNLVADYAVKKGYFGAACSPLVLDTRILVNVGGTAGIAAFELATGKTLWTATTDDASYSSPTHGKIAGRAAAVFLTRAGLVVVEPATGKVRHTLPFRARLAASVNAATPLVHGDEVFLTASYNTGALLLRANAAGEWATVWKNDTSLSCHYNTPVRVGDFLYGVDGRQEAKPQLRCIEWATGQVRWQQADFGCAPLIAVGNTLLALTEAGELVQFAATATAYQEQARAKLLDAPCRAAPALAEGRWYGRDEKRLICVDLTNK